MADQLTCFQSASLAFGTRLYRVVGKLRLIYMSLVFESSGLFVHLSQPSRKRREHAKATSAPLDSSIDQSRPWFIVNRLASFTFPRLDSDDLHALTLPKPASVPRPIHSLTITPG